jgi:hypothetical protein
MRLPAVALADRRLRAERPALIRWPIQRVLIATDEDALGYRRTRILVIPRDLAVGQQRH